MGRAEQRLGGGEMFQAARDTLMGAPGRSCLACVAELPLTSSSIWRGPGRRNRQIALSLSHELPLAWPLVLAERHTGLSQKHQETEGPLPSLGIYSQKYFHTLFHFFFPFIQFLLHLCAFPQQTKEPPVSGISPHAPPCPCRIPCRFRLTSGKQGSPVMASRSVPPLPFTWQLSILQDFH